MIHFYLPSLPLNFRAAFQQSSQVSAQGFCRRQRTNQASSFLKEASYGFATPPSTWKQPILRIHRLRSPPGKEDRRQTKGTSKGVMSDGAMVMSTVQERQGQRPRRRGDMEEQKGFGYRVRQARSRPSNASIRNSLVDDECTGAIVRFLKAAKVGKVKEGATHKGLNVYRHFYSDFLVFFPLQLSEAGWGIPYGLRVSVRAPFGELFCFRFVPQQVLDLSMTRQNQLITNQNSPSWRPNWGMKRS